MKLIFRPQIYYLTLSSIQKLYSNCHSVGLFKFFPLQIMLQAIVSCNQWERVKQIVVTVIVDYYPFIFFGQSIAPFLSEKGFPQENVPVHLFNKQTYQQLNVIRWENQS